MARPALAAAALVAAAVALGGPGALAQTAQDTTQAPTARAYLTPSRVIYPRQILRADMLEARLAEALPGGVATSYEEAIGKAARTTLAPGRVIPLAALGEPETVRAGGAVTLRFRAAGMDIAAAGVALEAGSAGSRIRARNAATGVVVSGLLDADATVTVGGGP
jgi:flagella basal body P-ring formation protein FlgA